MYISSHNFSISVCLVVKNGNLFLISLFHVVILDMGAGPFSQLQIIFRSWYLDNRFD